MIEQAFLATIGVLLALALVAGVSATIYAAVQLLTRTRGAWWVRTQIATRRPRRQSH